MVRPEVAIETTATRLLMLSIRRILFQWAVTVFGLRTSVAAAMYTPARILKM